MLTGAVKEPDALAADATQQQKKEYDVSLKQNEKAYGITLLTSTTEDETLQL